MIRLVFSPPTILLDAIGADAVLQVSGRDAADNAVNLAAAGVPVVWESRDLGVVSVANGSLTALDNGVTYVRATAGSMTDSARVTVDQRATEVVILAGDRVTLNAVPEQMQLVARAFDRLKNEVRNHTVGWSSLEPSIAQVDPNAGTVISLSPGVAHIVARRDGAADTVVVTVTNSAASIDVVPSVLNLTSIGDTVQLRAVTRNAVGTVMSGVSVVWHSSDPQVAAVLDDGRTIAVGAGTARVVASDGALADTAVVTVTNTPATIHFTQRADTLLFLGDTTSPTVELRNARGVALPPTSVIWSTDEPTIARVDAGGLITARDVGRTFIRATSGLARDSISVLVTNDPASVAIEPQTAATVDTLTALGQTLVFTAVARNLVGAVIPNAPMGWRSTNTSVAQVNGGGGMIAVGYGSASIIASTGGVSATTPVVVRNPTLLYVDNSMFTPARFGTGVRPYTRIQDAVAAADANDTVFVRRGAGPYSETVPLTRRVTVLGDSSAFVGALRDPLKLPMLSHDTGSAGVTAFTSAPITVRYLSVQHSIDGPAVWTRGSDVTMEWVYVNPAPQNGRLGRGILIEDSPSAAVITNSQVSSVRAYGVRLKNVIGGRVDVVAVRSVGAASGTTAGGIEISGGSGSSVARSYVRSTDGPQISFEATDSPLALGNDLAGETQLMRLAFVGGAPNITSNRFSLRREAGDPFTGNSSTDGRSGLEIRNSVNVNVEQNVFTDAPGTTSLMDAVRLIDARGGAYGARLLRDSFRGGRYSIRSERSTVQMLSSRSDSASIAVVLTSGDSLSMSADTLTTASVTCVSLSGPGTQLDVTGGLFSACADVGPAISATFAASLDLNGAAFSGANQRAISAVGMRRVTMRSNVVSGAGTFTAAPSMTVGTVDVAADTVRLVDNEVSDFRGYAGIRASGTLVRVDSNRVTRNRVGIRLGTRSTYVLVGNDIFDNDSLGLANDAAPLTIPTNFWGDARGPRNKNTPVAVGDSVLGSVTVDPVAPGPFTPGSVAAKLRKVRGDGQSGRIALPLTQAFTVRVMDAANRPVNNASVRFDVSNGSSRGTLRDPANASNPGNGTATLTVQSSASGLAEASFTPARTGSLTITVCVSAQCGTTTQTFTVTGTP
jgi:uncharacterized protein YjdB